VIRQVAPDSSLMEEILDGTYPVWGEGLTRQAYSAWNRGQLRTDWGGQRLRRVALVDGATLLASAKRYDFDARVGGVPVSVLGIGAVFTPPGQRKRGYARRLIDEMVEDAAARDCRYALLFSEIGPDYYASMGFREVPRSLVAVDVVPGTGAPATYIRAGETADLPAIAELTSRYDGDGFALDRSADLIAFGFARRRLLAGLGEAGRRQVEFFVAEEGHRPAAYVFITRGPAGAVLEEAGDRDPSGARVGAILQVLAARDPARADRPLRGWLPPSLRPPQLMIRDVPAAEIMMYRAIGDAPPIAGAITYWQTDVF
jgi:GNAT superfamily N-acetyltransferase